MKLPGRVAIITGSASGMGRAGAILFAKEGARVVVADVNTAGGQETENLIREAGGEACFVSTDVSKREQVEAMVSEAVKRYHGLDILWNNAAATKLCNEQDRPVHLLPESVWDQMLAVTLKGMYLCSKYALPQMMAARKGVVINTSSSDALLGQGGYDSYTAAKGGIVSMTRSMAVYYAQFGIRVNTICPGFVHTELQNEWMSNPKSRAAIEALHLTRVGVPEDIAKFALYLASDDAAYVTGGIFSIDGGCTAFKTHVTDYSAQ
jgi:NAD(P)-dependent dehydrogenase (short-subunit alcohol dehydrogenase family)